MIMMKMMMEMAPLTQHAEKQQDDDVHDDEREQTRNATTNCNGNNSAGLWPPKGPCCHKENNRPRYNLIGGGGVKGLCCLVVLIVTAITIAAAATTATAVPTLFVVVDKNNGNPLSTPSTIQQQQRQQPSPRPLPNMTTNGGMIVFLHVPKTGGSTIRHNFGKHGNPKFHSRVQYIVGNWRYKMDCHVAFIEQFLHGNISLVKNKKVLFLEVHGMDSYNALELQPLLQKWRQMAKHNDLSFFAFTMLRQALEAQVSFFNYYRLVADCRFEKVPMSRLRTTTTTTAAAKQTIMAQQFLIPWSYDNPQCLFLSRGERTFGEQPLTCYPESTQQAVCNDNDYDDDKVLMESPRRRRRRLQNPWSPPQRQQADPFFPPQYKPQMQALRANLTQTECQHVYQVLKDCMDWIGVLDRCNEETLPMLTSMIYNNVTMAADLEWDQVMADKVQHDPSGLVALHLQDMSDSIVEQLQAKSQWDDEMYLRASIEYTPAMWTNFPPPA